MQGREKRYVESAGRCNDKKQFCNKPCGSQLGGQIIINNPSVQIEEKSAELTGKMNVELVEGGHKDKENDKNSRQSTCVAVQATKRKNKPCMTNNPPVWCVCVNGK